MQTQDILENQPWTLIEDEFLGEEIPTLEDDDVTKDDDVEIPTDKPITKPVTKPADIPSDTDDNVFRILAEDLGIIVDNDWDGDAAEFKQLLIENAKSEAVSSLQLDNPIVDGFIKYVSSGGSPADFIQSMSVPSVDRMSSEDVYLNYMRSTTSLSDDKIVKLMNRAKDIGEFEDDVETFKEEMKDAQDKQVKLILKEQEREKLARTEQLKAAAVERKKIVKAKEILGVPITKNSEFEKFYLGQTVKVTYDGKQYVVTPYQKRLMERQEKPIEYEALLAYLEFTGYKLPAEATKIKNEATRDLKSKLTTFYSGNKVTRLIDES